MSIIEEALRRVKDPTLQHPASAASPRPPAPAAPAPQPRPAPAAHTHIPAATHTASAPTSNTALIILAGTLGFTVTLAVLSSMWMSWTSASRTAETPRAASEAAAVKAPESTAADTSQRTRSAARTLRTRTSARKSLAPVITPPNRFVVSGVAEGRGQSYAVINGKILSIGESLHGATLVDISEGTVRLRTDDGIDLALQIAR